jgi:hypothetical protein
MQTTNLLIGINQEICDGYFLLATELAAGAEPEISTHNTDRSNRKKLREGL